MSGSALKLRQMLSMDTGLVLSPPPRTQIFAACVMTLNTCRRSFTNQWEPAKIGYPQSIRVDQGSEFISGDLGSGLITTT